MSATGCLVLSAEKETSRALLLLIRSSLFYIFTHYFYFSSKPLLATTKLAKEKLLSTILLGSVR